MRTGRSPGSTRKRARRAPRSLRSAAARRDRRRRVSNVASLSPHIAASLRRERQQLVLGVLLLDARARRCVTRARRSSTSGARAAATRAVAASTFSSASAVARSCHREMLLIRRHVDEAPRDFGERIELGGRTLGVDDVPRPRWRRRRAARACCRARRLATARPSSRRCRSRWCGRCRTRPGLPSRARTADGAPRSRRAALPRAAVARTRADRDCSPACARSLHRASAAAADAGSITAMQRTAHAHERTPL